ncbi:aminopeptidase P N-terminal domain-containing protein [Duganella phyllosphaerae]|uniref:Xaa-Pro aminopeptidase n=1 Tax=Duganella phyllosphaerae TaxID=762836 RepID=A0A1E7WJL9_9BURK|nr:aminopeptidase P N-terminal domain-containing protein [Duganella phyllosphaerae]OEZ98828.1 Xaa-Pro aminopeptidase [Duganella phyllosphaerae]
MVAACANRRTRLLAQLPPGAVAVLHTAPEVARNGDSHYPYRYDSAFYYLTGFTEPESALVLVAARGDKPARSILFCRAKNPDREIWDGLRHGPQAARAAFGFDEAYPIEDLDSSLVRLRDHAPSGIDLLPLLAEMRLVKDDVEQATMQRAATISALAHVRAMQHARAGLHEYEIEAELLYEFRRHGAQGQAYPPIVAAGANACVLHYSANNALARDGDLVLIDAGCELDGYASDITRTWPVSGRFTAPQRQLYQLVLAAQGAALDAVVPGRPYAGIHAAALDVLAQGMLDLGLLDQNTCGSAADVIADKRHLQFYMHGTGHWLGLDVHDVGAYRHTGNAQAADQPQPSRALQAGMVLTVEPGIYVRPAPGVPEQYWNTGIRIEDDVLVTATGHTILSAAAPKSVADIEKLMQ